jgi:hypothetical protein
VLPMNVFLLTYKKIIPWFSLALGFHVKLWCTCTCVVAHCSLFIYTAHDVLNAIDELLIKLNNTYCG